MYKSVMFAVALALVALPGAYAQDVVHAVEGTVKKADAATRTIVVKSADGIDHTFHVTDRTAVHGTQDAVKGTRDAFHGVKEGSDVVVHYTTRGTERTADEIDHVGKNGLEVSEGTIKRIDREAKVLTVKTANGSEETFRLSDRAARDAGRDIDKGTDKSAKVTVYYSEEAGHKVAHFFKRVF